MNIFKIILDFLKNLFSKIPEEAKETIKEGIIKIMTIMLRELFERKKNKEHNETKKESSHA